MLNLLGGSGPLKATMKFLSAGQDGSWSWGKGCLTIARFFFNVHLYRALDDVGLTWVLIFCPFYAY